jgi:hypothetical protein
MGRIILMPIILMGAYHCTMIRIIPIVNVIFSRTAQCLVELCKCRCSANIFTGMV